MRAARVGVNCWKYGMLSAFVALLAGCGGRPAGDEALDDGTARAVVDGLRARYQVAVGPGSLARRPVLAPASCARVVPDGEGLRALWNEPSAAGVELTFPDRAQGAFRITHAASGVGVSARLVGARSAPAEGVDGYVVYRGAGPGGGAVVHRVTDAGTEDFLAFETKPDRGEVSYEIALSPEVAGLRLVGESLELLDSTRTPRLRVAPPFIVGRNGIVTEAALALDGCAADRDPSAPWDRALTAPGSDRCRLSVRWDADRVSYPALLDPAWTSTGNMATGRTHFIGLAISTGRVLVSGGFSAQGTALSSAELYDPSTGTWSSTAGMGTARADHAAALRGNGQVLVTGGDGGAGALATAQTYNPSTGTWTTRNSMGHARSNHRATALSNGDVLITGGTTDASLAAERFSGSTSLWGGAGTMLSYHAAHSATLLANGNVLSVGDAAPAGQIFNPSNNSWTATSTGSAPKLRSGHTGTRLSDGKVLIAGGNAGGGDPGTELFDPTTGTWSRTGNMWQAHTLHTATLLTDGRVAVFGNSFGNTRTLTEIYNPIWGTWSPGPTFSTPRDSHIAARLSDGRVLIAGGTGSGTSLTSAWRLDASTTAVTATEYQFAPVIDPKVINDRATEIWAVVHRPTTLPAGRLPVLIFLHGAHATCGTGSNPHHDDNDDYTTMGTCPPGYQMVKSYRGYDYVASELASRGYIVVSINANRGIGAASGPVDDFDLISARGKMILRHLEKLSRWNRGVETTPASIGVSLNGKLDLTQVGLMGHSRGGNGARSAIVQYQQAGSPWPGRIVDPVTFRGLFEIGPTDFEIGPDPDGVVVSLTNTSWAVLLPMCDGENGELPGVNVFDRMMAASETTVTPKATYTVWGANHEYYNTEWQVSELHAVCFDHRALFTSGNGITGSAEQRETAFQPMIAFFRSHVGATDAWFANLFNPESIWVFEPRVDRGYSPGLSTAQSKMLEDFLNPTGTSSYGLPNEQPNITLAHTDLPEHFDMKGADLAWSAPGGYFQTNFATAQLPFNLTSYQLLDVRVDRAFDPLNGAAPTDFQIQLVKSNGALSAPVSISAYNQQIDGPVGGGINNARHSMLQTVRIPLAHFGTTLSAITGVRFTFSVTPSGHIYLGHIRATKSTLVP